MIFCLNPENPPTLTEPSLINLTPFSTKSPILPETALSSLPIAKTVPAAAAVNKNPPCSNFEHVFLFFSVIFLKKCIDSTS